MTRMGAKEVIIGCKKLENSQFEPQHVSTPLSPVAAGGSLVVPNLYRQRLSRGKSYWQMRGLRERREPAEAEERDHLVRSCLRASVSFTPWLAAF